MKQKMIALLAIVSVFCSVSAQRVNETVTLFGKDQLQGFTINIDNYSIDVVDGAMANIFENQYKLKGSKKKGYHVYENQQCSAFGDARYDIYFTTTEIGKKNNKSVQVTLVVSNGNMNCITFTNDPRTSRNIVNFLEKFPRDVESYNTTLRIQSLENELTKLNEAAKEYWQNTITAYSVKTNSLPYLASFFSKHNVYAEVVSQDEFEMVKLCGYTEDNVVCNGPVKT